MVAKLKNCSYIWKMEKIGPFYTMPSAFLVTCLFGIFPHWLMLMYSVLNGRFQNLRLFFFILNERT